MISREVADWISQRKTGCILYTSPSRAVRDASLKAMAQFAVCTKAATPTTSCDCADCFHIKAGSHPHVQLISDETFDEKMKVLYSYPTPVVQIAEIHKIHFRNQAKLLIWLEAIGRQRFVMLTSNSEFSILPTIRSRSVIFTEIPRYSLSEEDRFKAQIFLQNLWSGKEKFESVTTPDDAKKMAFNLRHLVVAEIQSRMSYPPKRSIPGNDVELATLVKVLERYVSDPATHNLKLLLSGFSVLTIQGQR